MRTTQSNNWETDSWATPQWRAYYDEIYRMEFTPRLITDEQRLFGDKRCVLSPYYDTTSAAGSKTNNTATTDNAVQTLNKSSRATTHRQNHQEASRRQNSPTNDNNHTTSSQAESSNHSTRINSGFNVSNINSAAVPVAVTTEQQTTTVTTTTTAAPNRQHQYNLLPTQQALSKSFTVDLATDAPVTPIIWTQTRHTAAEQYDAQQYAQLLGAMCNKSNINNNSSEQIVTLQQQQQQPDSILPRRSSLARRRHKRLPSATRRRRQRQRSSTAKRLTIGKSKRAPNNNKKRPKRRSSQRRRRHRQPKVANQNANRRQKRRRLLSATVPDNNSTDGIFNPLTNPFDTCNVMSALGPAANRHIVSNKKILLNDRNSEMTMFSQRQYASLAPPLMRQTITTSATNPQQLTPANCVVSGNISPDNSLDVTDEQPCGMKGVAGISAVLSMADLVVSSRNYNNNNTSSEGAALKPLDCQRNHRHYHGRRNEALANGGLGSSGGKTNCSGDMTNTTTERRRRNHSPSSSFASCRNEQQQQQPMMINQQQVHQNPMGRNPMANFEIFDKRWIDRRHSAQRQHVDNAYEDIQIGASKRHRTAQLPHAPPPSANLAADSIGDVNYEPVQTPTTATTMTELHLRLCEPGNMPMLMGTCDSVAGAAENGDGQYENDDDNEVPEPFNKILSELSRLGVMVRRMALRRHTTATTMSPVSKRVVVKTTKTRRRNIAKRQINPSPKKQIADQAPTAAACTEEVLLSPKNKRQMKRSSLRAKPLPSSPKLTTLKKPLGGWQRAPKSVPKPAAKNRKTKLKILSQRAGPAGKLRVTRSQREASVRAVKSIYKQTASRPHQQDAEDE